MVWQLKTVVDGRRLPFWPRRLITINNALTPPEPERDEKLFLLRNHRSVVVVRHTIIDLRQHTT